MCPQEYLHFRGEHRPRIFCPTGQIHLGISVRMDRKYCPSLGKCVRSSPWPEIGLHESRSPSYPGPWPKPQSATDCSQFARIK